jgi:16S rRNA (cytosine967-C5)-methyltransferase
MTPGARLQAAIELIAAIETGGGPADDVVGNYFRRHRFAGVQDRGAISKHIYAVLRRRAAVDWWIRRVGAGLQPTPRLRVFTAALIFEGWTAESIAKACDGDPFRPSPLDGAEQRAIQDLTGGRSPEHPEMPIAVRYNFPDWLQADLTALFGESLGAEMEALNGNAALDLRANRLKGTRAEIRAALLNEGVKADPTRYSPLGLRVHGRIPLATLEVFKSGGVEVQDEGSQLAALLTEAKPGMRVVDFCAGAGGKTLALAAEMQNKGYLLACDISEKRLERSGQRLRRAGVSNVERRALSSERDKWVKRHTESFDRVFVDAPCTGTGTWRRNPDAKWRLTPQDLDELVVLQGKILDSAARLVKPGGRLVYATCSLLPRENDLQIQGFLAGHADFRLLPVGEIWRSAIGGECPAPGPMLHLTPARHGTDGFFVAVLERQATAPAETQDE